jgi:hypothetical protein
MCVLFQCYDNRRTALKQHIVTCIARQRQDKHLPASAHDNNTGPLLGNSYALMKFTGDKATRAWRYHSPPASADFKKMWIYVSNSHTPSWRSA